MAQAQFPEPPDLDVPFINRIGDSKQIDFGKWTVDNPHPNYGKDPNIQNEFGHTVYPKYVGNVIVNSKKEEEALLAKTSVPEAPQTAWQEQKPTLREDGPTIHEYVAAGYKAKEYPPKGWASKSTQQEIDLAIADEETAEAKAATGWGTKI